MQIPVLSSKTKKGEIERTFPSFCVLDNNSGDHLTVCQSAAVKYILHVMTSGFSPRKISKGKENELLQGLQGRIIRPRGGLSPPPGKLKTAKDQEVQAQI